MGETELAERARELERRMAVLEDEIWDLPKGAPLRGIKAARFAEFSKELGLVKQEMMVSSGQLALFEGAD